MQVTSINCSRPTGWAILLLVSLFLAALPVQDVEGHERAGTEYRQESTIYGWQSDFVGPGPLESQTFALATFQDELIIAGRALYADDKLVNHIARWDGIKWQPLKGPDGSGVEVDPSFNGWPDIKALQVFEGKLIVSGSFNRAGGVPADGLAVWDGTSWQAFQDNDGARFNGAITQMTVFNGELIVSGGFTQIDDLLVNGLARWNGTSWRPLAGPNGVGLGNPWANALLVHDGKLVVGGQFFQAGGVAVDQVAVWNGSNWSRLEGAGVQGIQSGYVSTLGSYNGDLIAAGAFEDIGDLHVRNIARWDGSEWHAMAGPGGLPWPNSDAGLDDEAYSMVVHEGQLIVGGRFRRAGGTLAGGVAAWNGQQWSALQLPEVEFPVNVEILVRALAIHNGNLMAGGAFLRLGDQTTRNVARWDSPEWTPLASTHDFGIHSQHGFSPGVLSLILHDDHLFVGGRFTNTGSLPSENIARWNGASWVAMPGISGSWVSEVSAMINFGGDLIAGGDFSHAGDVQANGIARWDGDQWHELEDQNGIGLWPSSARVNALAIYNEELIVAGRFSSAGGVTVNSIVRWNGNSWAPLTGSNGTGVSTPAAAEVLSLAVVDGELFVGGRFHKAGGLDVVGIARWNGQEWLHVGQQPFEPDFSRVRQLVEYQGQLHAAGDFLSAGGVDLDGIARWSGTEWLPLSRQINGPARIQGYAMHVHEDKLVVSGVQNPPTGPVFNGLAAWDGQAWSAFTGPGLPGFTSNNLGEVPLALATYAGDLYAGGNFWMAGGVPAWKLSRYLRNPIQIEINQISPEFSDLGQAVTISVSVTGSAELPAPGMGLIRSDTGYQCMSDEMTPAGSQTLTFSCDISFDESGFHQLTAHYESLTAGDSAISQPMVHGVKALSTTSGYINPQPSQHAGQRIYFGGSVSAPFDNEGTVVIKIDDHHVCTTQNTSSFLCLNTSYEIGERLVTFSYSGSDMVQPSSYSQTYTIIEPLLELMPGSLGFGVVNAGTEIQTKSTSLTNRSDTPIEIISISAALPPFHKHPDSDCESPPFTLQPDSSCLLVYAFDPEAGGDFSRRISVRSNLSDGWHYLFLAGTGRDELLHDRFEGVQ